MRIALIVSMALATPALAGEPPASLQCLTRYYGGSAVERGGEWFLALSDGKSVPFDDKKPKSFDQKLETPDVKDAFSIRYRKGAIQPVNEENDDPGRIRVEALFS